MTVGSNLVVNNIVKMEWEKKGFLMTAKKAFIFASKEYETEKGTITVFFNANTAFVWDSDAGKETMDVWDASDLKQYLKTSLDGAFPVQYDEYVPVIAYGDSDIAESAIDKYGLGEYVEDIKARLEDVKPFGKEEDALSH